MSWKAKVMSLSRILSKFWTSYVSSSKLTQLRHLAQAIKTACLKDQKAWGGHTSNFSQIIDEVVGFEEDVGARLD